MSAPPSASHPWLSPRNLLWASVAVAVVTIALKTLAWVVTGSVGLLSDAMESFVNLASAMFALAMVTVAQRPADDDHPYGHHKAEYFSSGFEGILIMGVSAGILWAAGHRLFDPQPIEQVGWGLGLSVLSSALNGLLAWVMFRSAREHRSIALEADARHLMTDVWTTVGVVVGVALAGASGWLWLDPVVAGLVALNILREGWHLLARSFDGLMDHALPPADVALIEQTLNGALEEGCRIGNLRTRQAGMHRFALVDLIVPGDWSVARAHDLADRLEEAVEAAAHTRLTTHVEPAEGG